MARIISTVIVALFWSPLLSCDDVGPSTCVASEESCNGYDDDCDGEVDEDESGGLLYRDCGNACGEGTEECVDGRWASCTAPQPSEEVCDGVDNDCDGYADEYCACLHSTSRPCGRTVGICEQGVQYCEHGEWSECQQTIAPGDQDEVCDDGLDNDCDGLTDENCP